MKSPKSETITVTPAMAEKWLAETIYSRQRRRVDWHVRRLAMEIEKGRFVEGTQIHFGVLDGSPKLVNGQHTLAAIAQSGIPTKLTILRTPVENEDELGQLYGRHDRHRSRTPADAFLGMALQDKLDLHSNEVNAFATGLRWVLNDFKMPHVTVNLEIRTSLDYLADQMETWAPVARRYFQAVRDANAGLKGAYRRMPVVAVGLATMKFQPEKASTFWEAAAADDMLSKHDPRHVLNGFLRRSTATTFDPLNSIRNVAACWNRWFENGELQILRPSNVGKIGLTLKGTPFKARDRSGQPSRGPDDEVSVPSGTQGVLSMGAPR